ncbi:U32 family peptidase [candidate division KSB1 bacterium]|nr:U32 family peptidase [candidate division KSB1 bacterium]
MKHIELMAPAGSWESLSAALKAGCDSVYFGVSDLNMRANSAKKFTMEDLPRIVSRCHKKKVKCYLTLNVVMYDEDLDLMRELCDSAKSSGVDAVIATDMAAILYARSIDLDVHCSTQVNVSNIEAVKFFSQHADVIVLARELNLDQISRVCQQIQEQNITGPSGTLLGIEIFVHGALCVSIAGKCYMSLAIYDSSANRGKCFQPCRREYLVKDVVTGNELTIDNRYIMSPKDLCTIRFIDKILESGVSVLKIEGRGRSADYVYTVVKSYREAVELCAQNEYNEEKALVLEQELKTVFNRGFWHGGYYLGHKLGEWTDRYGSQATEEKTFIGRIKNYYPRVGICQIHLTAKDLRQGSEILIVGPTTGIVRCLVGSLHDDNGPVEVAKQGDKVTVPVPEKVRPNDSVYIVSKRT